MMLGLGTYILTPRRTVGDDAICDRSGPKFWAIGTITGENKGMAKLASCDINRKLSYLPKDIYLW